MKKFLPISLKLNFTPNALGCHGFMRGIFKNNQIALFACFTFIPKARMGLSIKQVIILAVYFSNFSQKCFSLNLLMSHRMVYDAWAVVKGTSWFVDSFLVQGLAAFLSLCGVLSSLVPPTIPVSAQAARRPAAERRPKIGSPSLRCYCWFLRNACLEKSGDWLWVAAFPLRKHFPLLY